MPGGSVYTVSVIGYVTGGLALVVQYTLPLDYHPPTSIPSSYYHTLIESIVFNVPANHNINQYPFYSYSC